MSIRWKLFAALFLLTAGSIAIVLLVAEREFHSWVRGEVTRRFEDRLEGLLETRSERLADTRALCSRLATDPVIKAMLEGDRGSSRREVLLDVIRELRLSEPGSDGRKRPGLGSPGRSPGSDNRPGRKNDADPPGRATGTRGIPLVGVIDREGTIHHLGPNLQRSAARRRQAAERIKTLSREATQQVSYVVLENDTGRQPLVQEVVLTPVIDDDGNPMGWFFLGTNAETQVERTFQAAERATGSDTRYGMVVEDRWFVRGVSDAQATAIEGALPDGFWTAGQPALVESNNQRFLVVARDLNPGSPLGKGYQIGIFPLDGFHSALGRLRTTVGWIGAGAVLVTSVFALVMAARFSRPIAELVAGTERIRRGELHGSVNVRRKDEFGTLATAFNTMTRDLALKERYREVLAKTSDPAVAQQLVEGRLELGGEVRQAAVLFCDIRGFTAMTEGMPPAEVIEFVNEHMTALTKLVYLHGGVVDKFVGDLIMAVFGAPNSHGDDALRAARCALEMINVRKELSTSTGRIVEIGIGVAYGELVAGCMGSTDRLNYTVLGDRVNLASRLCSDAGPGEVIVDEAIAAALDGSIHAEPRDPVTLKGFSAPVPSFAIRPKSETA